MGNWARMVWDIVENLPVSLTVTEYLLRRSHLSTQYRATSAVMQIIMERGYRIVMPAVKMTKR